MKIKFKKYIEYKDGKVISVSFAPDDSAPVLKEEYIEIPKDLKLQVGEEILIENGKVTRKPKEEKKKGWFSF